MDGNPPGTYRLEIDENNSTDELILRTSDRSDLPNFQFDAPTGSDSTFIFDINIQGGTFSEPPVTWRDPNTKEPIDPPSGIQHVTSEDRTSLTLQVTPPDELTGEQAFHFTFNFDGIDPGQGDPTIVEKPPEGSVS